ncbi:MAG: hypothetical protein FWB90_01995 [Fibromonadales bacterium]|nr:hypothetical protein [Fibromonadales bacterium]
MKKSRNFFVSATLSVVLAGFVFFGCSGDTEAKPHCDDSETCLEDASSSSDDEQKHDSSSSAGGSGTSSSSNEEQGSSSSSSNGNGNEPSSSSQTPSATSSSSSVSNNASSSSATETTSSSSSSRPSSSSAPAAGSNCGYQPSWCGGIAFSDIVTASINGNAPDGPACIYATSISKLGNQSEGTITVNGKTLKANWDTDQGGRCGNTDWGQKTCSQALTDAGVTKVDGGYYIYVPGWGGDFSTTGASGSIACSGVTPSQSSSSARSSSSGTTVTPQSSSSNTSSTPTLTCASVPSTGTAGTAIAAPVVQCNGSTVTGSNITWSGAPTWSNPTAGTYNNVRATATSGNCSGMQANCSGTLTVSAAPTPSSSSQGNTGGGTPCSQCSQDMNSGTKNYKTTRYWDSCKPSCAWTANASGSPNGAAKSCSVNGSKLSDVNAANACQSGPAYTCMDQVPWAINDNLAYGFAASHSNSDCGKCFLVEFTNNGEGGTAGGNVSGKRMVLMVTNIGGDVGGDQFDIMIPGGGVGAFNALTNQISQLGGGSNTNMGAQYGGFRADYSGGCGPDAACIRTRCASAFSGSQLANMKAGCDWFIDWFKIANNPAAKSKEITCPSELTAKYK